MKQTNVIDGTFTSEWDDGAVISTPCKVNVDTREIFDIQVCTAVTPDGTCEREFVVFPGSEEEYDAHEKSEYEDLDCPVYAYWYR